MLTGLNSNTAQNLQLGAGAILKAKHTAGTKITAEDILSATNGGITFNAVPEWFTPSVDGMFDNIKGGGKRIIRWVVTLSFTAVEADAEVLARALGCADTTGNVIKGRHTINAAIYISEAQNLDIELMRLALQRIGDDSICILDGDSNTQVDLSMYAGDSNGMRRVSKIFRGADFYGEVTLQKIHRSKIAELAQEL